MARNFDKQPGEPERTIPDKPPVSGGLIVWKLLQEAFACLTGSAKALRFWNFSTATRVRLVDHLESERRQGASIRCLDKMPMTPRQARPDR
jgi:hypothetical protein